MWEFLPDPMTNYRVVGIRSGVRMESEIIILETRFDFFFEK